MTNKEIFTKAADLLEERGWCQGALRNADGCMCALGALIEACGGFSGEYITTRGALQQRLGVRAPDWNDHPARTKEEVIAKLRELARDQ